MSRAPVIILGAGLAGLVAARRLHAASIPVLVLEARDRPGGRILTTDATGTPSDDGVDLGPSWFWPHMQPAIGRLVDELGLENFAQYSDGDVIFERMSREGPRRFHSEPQEPRSFRLAGGSAALVRALVRDLPAHAIRLNARVTDLTLTDAGVQVLVHTTDGRREELTASHVIAALPPRLLEDSVRLVPAIDPHIAQRWRSTPTWMAPHAKFFALYDTPFWRQQGLCGTAQSMVGPMPEIHDATSASGQAALFGFLGPGADQRAALGDAALTQACVEQLVRLFGEKARTPRATLLKDWAADSLTATSADRVASGHPVPTGTPWVTMPWADRLVLGGSETSASEPGYLAGAVVAGEQAAEAVRQRWPHA